MSRALRCLIAGQFARKFMQIVSWTKQDAGRIIFLSCLIITADLACADVVASEERAQGFACRYAINGDFVDGSRTSDPPSTDGTLRCLRGKTTKIADVRKRIITAVKLIGDKRPRSNVLTPDELSAAGMELACANLLLGEDTLSDAETILDSVAQNRQVSQAISLAQTLKRGPVKFSSATPSACKPEGYAEPLPDAVWADMRGKSWHANAGCPAREDLHLLHVPFVDFEGYTRIGELVVAKSEADAVVSAFGKIYAAGSFPIARMERVDKYGGNDMASMTANNTSAFNCRVVSGTSVLSEHGKGLAIDINPVENPFVGSTSLEPETGKPYRDRASRKPGMISPGDSTYEAFSAIGWKWGGAWKNARDYQHFSKSGK